MYRSTRLIAVACLALGVGGHSPTQAIDETVTVLPPISYAHGGDAGMVLLAVCAAYAAPQAAWTRVRCEVGGTQYVLRVPQESPVAPGGLVWNLSDTTMTGPVATAVWEGGGRPPLRLCAHAEAAYNRPSGPSLVVTAEPVCRTIDAP